MPLIEPSLLPPSYLRPAWIQTIAPTLLRNPPATYGVFEQFELPDGDFLELEWYAPKPSRATSVSAPADHDHQPRHTFRDTLVILTHGLEGSTKSSYLRGLIAALTKRAYPVLAWNMRGCGTQRNRLLTWYHSGETRDLAAIVKLACTRYPQHAIALVGVSIGGNIVCKYLGEQGSAISSVISQAIAISPPLDLRGSAGTLAHPSRALYMNYLLRPLRSRMKEKASRFPSMIDIRALHSIRSFHEFDSRFTAPLHGFASVDEYWELSSGARFLPAITVPTYILSALDDPFLSPGCFPTQFASTSGLIHLETPKHGGHVGFIDSLAMGETWLEKRVAAYLSLAAPRTQ
jgi:predicted alpha/beta-fold hydrolase